MVIKMGVGLVLEGGGMRGVYTSGVLDCLLNNNIELDKVYAVSAGAANGISYVSKQPRRSFNINIRFCHDHRYLDPLGVFNENMFKMDFAFNVIPEKYFPFDNDTFKASKTELVAVTTDCMTGRPAYFSVKDMDTDYRAVMASCSLPVVTKPVILNGVPHLDGGISDPIPLKHSIDKGNEKNIVILTRPVGYRKKPQGHASSVIGRLKYKHFPHLLRTAAGRADIYNKQLDLVCDEEVCGNALVFRPASTMGVGRTESDPIKLMALYRLGYSECSERIEEIKTFINGDSGVSWFQN